MKAPTSTNSAAAFQWRAFTSVMMTVGFLLLAVSGTVLFLAPPGRVANWTNWTMLGLRKSEWGGLHIWFGTLFLGLTILHVVYNWRPLVSYFKDRITRSLGFRKEWAVATAVSAVVFVGTRAGVAPFSSFLDWNEEFKASWEKTTERAPIPHAELLTLAALAEKGGVDLAVATTRLAAKGITGFTGDTVVQRIADAAKLPARDVYAIIMSAPKGAGGHAEGQAGGGLGWKTLTQFCAEEGIALDGALARLVRRGLKADAAMTLREIAANNGQKPYELVEFIRARP